MNKHYSLTFLLCITHVYIYTAEHPVQTRKGIRMDITKAVIPAAGLGTRFLPWTKSVAKEMLPLIDSPAIQYIIEEGLDSGLLHFYIITSKDKTALSNHFDSASDLEARLKEKNKEELLARINRIMKSARFTYIRQAEPLGLGHAILMARHVINNEYFGVFLPDDILMAQIPGMAQLVEVAKKYNATVVAVQEVSMDSISSYGVVAPKQQLGPDIYEISHLVEKPKKEDAPSNLAIIGRYILSPKIFDAIEAITPLSKGEIQLTDAIDYLIKSGEKVIAYKYKGERFDTGTPLGWIQANVYLALRHPSYKSQIYTFLKQELDIIDKK